MLLEFLMLKRHRFRLGFGSQDLFLDRPPDTECDAEQNLYCFKSSINVPAFGFRMMFVVPLTCLTGLEQLPGFHPRRTLPPYLALLPFSVFIFLEIAGWGDAALATGSWNKNQPFGFSSKKLFLNSRISSTTDLWFDSGTHLGKFGLITIL